VGEPEIRANHSKHVIARVKCLPEPQRTRILATIAPLRGRVREAGIFDWLPAAVHVELVDSVNAALRQDEVHGFWRELILDGFARALLRPLVSGALGVYGPTPHSFLRLVPHAWTLVIRECGVVAFERKSDNEASLEFSKLPRVIDQSPGMLAFFQGGLQATYRYFKKSGQVELVTRRTGCAEFAISWE
jgi:hypothetical protein